MKTGWIRVLRKSDKLKPNSTMDPHKDAIIAKAIDVAKRSNYGKLKNMLHKASKVVSSAQGSLPSSHHELIQTPVACDKETLLTCDKGTNTESLIAASPATLELKLPTNSKDSGSKNSQDIPTRSGSSNSSKKAPASLNCLSASSRKGTGKDSSQPSSQKTASPVCSDRPTSRKRSGSYGYEQRSEKRVRFEESSSRDRFREDQYIIIYLSFLNCD